MDTNANEIKKTCHRCQAVFSCWKENCWCEKLPQVIKPLSENEDCLCPDCLKIEIENKLAQ
jgi:hypothetical protein